MAQQKSSEPVTRHLSLDELRKHLARARKPEGDPALPTQLMHQRPPGPGGLTVEHVPPRHELRPLDHTRPEFVSPATAAPRGSPWPTHRHGSPMAQAPAHAPAPEPLAAHELVQQLDRSTLLFGEHTHASPRRRAARWSLGRPWLLVALTCVVLLGTAAWTRWRPPTSLGARLPLPHAAGPASKPIRSAGESGVRFQVPEAWRARRAVDLLLAGKASEALGAYRELARQPHASPAARHVLRLLELQARRCEPERGVPCP